MMRKMTWVVKGKLGASQGFTIVELLVVMLVSGILMAGMLGVYYGVQRSFADTGSRMVNQDDARTATNQAARYIRAAQSSDSNLTSKSDAIALASPQEIVFYADVDGVVDANGKVHAEKVRYYLNGQSLQMATTAPNLTTSPPTYPSTPTSNSTVVMNGIVNGSTPIFTYYQLNPNYATNPIPGNDNLVVISNPTSAADLASIVAVGMTFYVNENPAASKNSVELYSLVQIRQRYNGGLSGS